MNQKDTIENLRGRVALLEQVLLHMGQVVFDYMPPAGQERLQEIQDDLNRAREEWAAKFDS